MATISAQQYVVYTIIGKPTITTKKGARSLKLRDKVTPSSIVNIPYGGSELIGKQLVFENYQQFKSFCQDNGIDTGTYIDEEMKNSLKYSRGILFEVFDTNARAGGVLNENEKTLAFLQSLEEFEYDPAFDGKVTAAVYPLAVNTSWTIESYYEG